MTNIQQLIVKLHDPNPNKRYEACEELRVSPSLPNEALEALRKTTQDENPLVADAAKRALDLHKPMIPDKPSVSTPSPIYVSPPMPSGSPNSPEYVFALEKRIMVLEMEVRQLTRDVNLINDSYEPERINIPKSWVMSPNFIERAFAIWGHYFVAQVIIAIPIYCLVFIILGQSF